MRGLSLGLYVSFVLALVSTAALITALVWRAESQASFQELSRDNCEQIEALKQNVRAEASETYANLDRTLRILRLERTAEIVAVARENRDRKLARFAPRDCLVP